MRSRRPVRSHARLRGSLSAPCSPRGGPWRRFSRPCQARPCGPTPVWRRWPVRPRCRKHLAAAALIIAGGLTLAACGGNDDSMSRMPGMGSSSSRVTMDAQSVFDRQLLVHPDDLTASTSFRPMAGSGTRRGPAPCRRSVRSWRAWESPSVTSHSRSGVRSPCAAQTPALGCTASHGVVCSPISLDARSKLFAKSTTSL